jgi:preprotein translocase subunit YajC
VKLGTLKSAKSLDGDLCVISRDLKTAVKATHIAPSLREAMEAWAANEADLKKLYNDLNEGDDYTAKSYAKMAETSDGRKYLNSVIKQMMKPLKESAENKKADELEVGDRVVITGKVMHQGDEGEIVEFGKDKKFVTVKLDNDNKTRSFHSTDVTDLKAKYADDDEEDDFEDQPDEDVFYVTVVSMDDSDGGDGFVGKVAIVDGKWRELPAVGKPHYKWGQRYMGYLSQSDIMQYIRQDFGRYYNVKGPFNTLADAKDEAEDSGLELDESAQNMTSSFMNKAFSTSTVNEDSIGAADKNKLLKLLGALKQRSKAANLSSGEKYMISDRMERIQGRLDALDKKVDEAITYTDIEDWKKAVKNSYPQHASKMRFNGRMEGGKMTVSAEIPGEDRCFGVWDQEDEKGEVLSESTNLERKQKRIGLMIDDYIKRSKATTNDIKKSHYLDMADQLRAQLADLKLTEADEPSEDEKAFKEFRLMPAPKRGEIVRQFGDILK